VGYLRLVKILVKIITEIEFEVDDGSGNTTGCFRVLNFVISTNTMGCFRVKV